MPSKVKDITGQKFGKLIVVGFAYIDKSGSSWYCQCDCGKERTLKKNSLTSGHTRSCGCGMLESRQQQAIRAFGYKKPRAKR